MCQPLLPWRQVRATVMTRRKKKGRGCTWWKRRTQWRTETQWNHLNEDSLTKTSDAFMVPVEWLPELSVVHWRSLSHSHTETHSQLVLVLILQPHFPPENNDLTMIMQCLKLRGLNLFSHRYIRWHVLMGGINPEQLTLLVQHFTPGCKHRSATQNDVAIMLICVVQNIPRLQHKLALVAQLILTKPKESFVLTYFSPSGCKPDSTFVLWAFHLSALNY